MDKGHLRLPADLVHRPGQAEGGRFIAPPAETPLILVGRDGRQGAWCWRRMLRLRQRALARRCMPATNGPGAGPGRLVIQDADPAGDAEALSIGWRCGCSGRFHAPIIAADAPNGIRHRTPPARITCMATKLRCLPRCSRSSAASVFASAPPSPTAGARPMPSRASALGPATCPSRARPRAMSLPFRLAPRARYGWRPPGARLRAHR